MKRFFIVFCYILCSPTLFYPILSYSHKPGVDRAAYLGRGLGAEVPGSGRVRVRLEHEAVGQGAAGGQGILGCGGLGPGVLGARAGAVLSGTALAVLAGGRAGTDQENRDTYEGSQGPFTQEHLLRFIPYNTL